MDLSKKKASGAKINVVAGSVWESRIKSDQVRGGIKVFNAEDGENGIPATAEKLRNSTIGGSGGGGVSTRRKTWKSEGFEGFSIFDKKSILIAEEEEEEEEELRSDGEGRRKPINESVKSFSEPGKGVVLRKKMDQSRKSANGFSSKQTTKVKNESKFEECKEKKITKLATQGFVDARDWCNGEEEEEEEDKEESEIEIEKQSFDIKEINIPERKKIVNDVKKFHQINGKTTFSTSESFQENKQKLHSLMDLIMWKDIFRSGAVFGLGISIIILSFFTKNITMSFITVISYLGLLFLAAIFLHRSIICSREGIDSDDEKYIIGEEEAIWIAKLFLPYVNDLLQNLKALFRGDPAITMKLAVLLFVLAKCGSFITIWNVLKWGFVGVFTVPKFCSQYSTQLFTHGEHWMKHAGNSWNSCPHKKGIAIAIFFVVWNFSSIMARLWSVFILFVTLRYYRKSSVRDGWVEEEEELTSKSSSKGERLCNNGHTVMASSKQKRPY